MIGNGCFVLSAGSLARFLARRPRWEMVQRWLMGTVLSALAVRQARAFVDADPFLQKGRAPAAEQDSDGRLQAEVAAQEHEPTGSSGRSSEALVQERLE